MRRAVIMVAALLTLFAGEIFAAKPKLVVQIVVGGLRYDFLERFGENFGQGGLRRFLNEGVSMTDSRYNFMQTLTPATLATITTGANPSTHGVVSDRWADNITGRRVYLVSDPEAVGLNADEGIGNFSPINLIAPTLGDRLREESPSSKVATVAFDPISAVVMGGFTEQVYWLDATRFNWISSSKYMSSLPEWVLGHNKQRSVAGCVDYKWELSRSASRYRNSSFSRINAVEDGRVKRKAQGFDSQKEIPRELERVLYTPAANTLLVEFAKQVLSNNRMGTDDHCDLMNICFDAPRYILERYGSGSMEFEDMLYRLDSDIADLVGFIFSQVRWDEVVIVLTGDHGTCDVQTLPGRDDDKFNPVMLRMLLDGFLSSQYGAGDWVMDYSDRQIFLNRNLMYINNLSPDQVQERAATFVLQFRGVANVATASAMQKGYYGGDGVKMQNSFYPKRGGDLTINLMPGWIEDTDGKVSLSGSLYGYDTHVPLIFMGGGLKAAKVGRAVEMKDLAPTLASIMGVESPVAATGRVIDEIALSF